jgi:hypothetical protein
MRRRELLAGSAALGAHAALSRVAEAFGIGQLGADFGRAGLLGGGGGFRPNYFVNSVTGSDSNNGRSPATAWQTVTKVNASAFQPGDVIGFAGGQTFATKLTVPSSGSTSARIAFTSYGAGRATLAPATGDALDIIDKENIIIDNINLNPTTGSPFYLSANSVTRNNVTLQNFSSTVGGGCYIGGDAGTGGWNNLFIQNFSISGQVNDGIGIYGSGGAGVKVHTNITVQNGNISNCTHSGCYFGNVNGGTLSNVRASGCGSTSTSGPIGLWTYESNSVVIKFCESYNNTSANTTDGGGFDIDGGCTNCVIEYCYAHGNFGAGFLCWNYGALTWNNNTIRYCIGQNNGTQPSDFYGEVAVGHGAAASTCSNALIYNNTFYNNQAGGRYLITLQTDAAMTGRLANNIFYSASNTGLIFSTGNASSMLFTGNDYFASGTFSISWNGTSYGSFAAWQTATSQEKIAGSNVGLTSDPSLVNPGGGGTIGGYNPAQPSAYMLHAGSPMIGTGLDMNAQFAINPGTQDFYGNTIPRGGLFPVGAYAGAGV